MSPEFSRYKDALANAIEEELEGARAQVDILDAHLLHMLSVRQGWADKAARLTTAKEVVTGLPNLSIAIPDKPDGVSLNDFQAGIVNSGRGASDSQQAAAFRSITILFDANAKLAEANVSSSLPIEIFSAPETGGNPLKDETSQEVTLNGKTQTLEGPELTVYRFLAGNPLTNYSVPKLVAAIGIKPTRVQQAIRRLRLYFDDSTNPHVFAAGPRGTRFVPPNK